MDVGVAPPAFRLPADTRVGLVDLQVSDLDRSIAFYTTVIGLRVLTSIGETAVLGDQGASPLVRLHAQAGTRPVGRRGLFGLYHFAILLPDRPALGRFASHLIGSDVRFGMADHFVSEALYLSDPDGLGIEMYADRARTLWRQRAGELVMGTEPLDLRDVMKAGAAGAWTGAPSGTTIGHLHLHVGDLGHADAFYRLALGFDKTVWSYPGALFFSAGGYHHHLGTNTWAPGPAAGEEDARLLAWELVLPTSADRDAAVTSLTRARYEVRPDTSGTRSVSDPWGTRLTLVGAHGAAPPGL